MPKIFLVDSRAKADVKGFFTNIESKADVKGYLVDSPHLAETKVFIVDHEAEADVKIFLVNSISDLYSFGCSSSRSDEPKGLLDVISKIAGMVFTGSGIGILLLILTKHFSSQITPPFILAFIISLVTIYIFDGIK